MISTYFMQTTFLIVMCFVSSPLMAVIFDSRAISDRYEVEGVLSGSGDDGVAVIRDKFNSKKLFVKVGEALDEDVYVKDVIASKGVVLSDGIRSINLNFDPFRSTPKPKSKARTFDDSLFSDYAKAPSRMNASPDDRVTDKSARVPVRSLPDYDWDEEFGADDDVDASSPYSGDEEFYDVGEGDSGLSKLEQNYDNPSSFSARELERLRSSANW